jgi:hypothetical protein
MLGLVHCTPSTPLLPRALSGNGPISNFWAPGGLRAHLLYDLYSLFHPSLCLSQYDMIDSCTSPPNGCMTLSLFHTQPLPSPHNSKRDAQALCAAIHVPPPIYMSHLPSIGVSLYKWPIHYTGRTCSTKDVK